MKHALLSLFAALSFSLSAAVTAADKGDIELVYVEWSSEVASTHLLRVVLENIGYTVKMTSVSGAAMWQAVGSGDADAMVAAWLPTTHGHYLQKVQDKIENLGANLTGTRIGLVVPHYVSIDSIAEIKQHADKFNKKIIGIDPGAGIMSKTETAIKAYELGRIKLLEGSGATMTAALNDAVKNQQWIVVTGWTPHWKFARWSLKYLQDPKNIYGGAETINTIVRKGLQADKPEAYEILDKFNWTAAQMAELMAWNQAKGADPYVNAQRWVAENAETVNTWLPAHQ